MGDPVRYNGAMRTFRQWARTTPWLNPDHPDFLDLVGEVLAIAWVVTIAIMLVVR